MKKPKKVKASAGNHGQGIRSDCLVEIELTTGGGRVIQVSSKVDALYGRSIRELAGDMLEFFGITDANLTLYDSGAIPSTLMARIEGAVKKLIDSGKEYLPDLIDENLQSTEKERFRFSRLYLPGNSPALMINAGLHSPDGIILDLEDSVAPAKKDEARLMVRNALRAINFYGAERMVRINQGERGLEDLDWVVPHNVNMILIPKCESADQVKLVGDRVSAIQKEAGLDSPVWFMPIIESALGVENAYSIATATNEVASIAIGLEDYTADLGVQRTQEGQESLYARRRLVNAAKAAGIQPIDSVFSDVADMEALAETARRSREMGFEGMGCIHPRQIAPIHNSFAPTPIEIVKAKKIVEAYHLAEKSGSGVVSLGSKMIDPPVVKRALKTISLAESFGILDDSAGEQEETTGNNN